MTTLEAMHLLFLFYQGEGGPCQAFYMKTLRDVVCHDNTWRIFAMYYGVKWMSSSQITGLLNGGAWQPGNLSRKWARAHGIRNEFYLISKLPESAHHCIAVSITKKTSTATRARISSLALP